MSMVIMWMPCRHFETTQLKFFLFSQICYKRYKNHIKRNQSKYCATTLCLFCVRQWEKSFLKVSYLMFNAPKQIACRETKLKICLEDLKYVKTAKGSRRLSALRHNLLHLKMWRNVQKDRFIAWSIYGNFCCVIAPIRFQIESMLCMIHR